MMRLPESKWRTVTAANTGQDVAAGESIFDELVEGWVRDEEAQVAAEAR